MNPQKLENVMFSDSKSVLECLENRSQPTCAIKDLELTLDNFNDLFFSKQVTLHWIPSHCFIKGNDLAESLAKIGVLQE